MDWKSNFSKDELRRIEQIKQYKSQVGYDPGSDLDILARMVSILDNAEGVVNSTPSPAISNPYLDRLIKGIFADDHHSLKAAKDKGAPG